MESGLKQMPYTRLENKPRFWTLRPKVLARVCHSEAIDSAWGGI